MGAKLKELLRDVKTLDAMLGGTKAAIKLVLYLEEHSPMIKVANMQDIRRLGQVGECIFSDA